MTYSKLSTSLSGYETCDTLQVHYYIYGGVQNTTHPNLGCSYPSTNRNAYLPNNTIGQKVLQLLHMAFERGLTFTVGTSMTLGLDNLITWNDIDPKTTQHWFDFGYPNHEYMDRVLGELKDNGIE